MEPARILIVEDEQIVAADLERTLRRLGYDVVGLAISGQQAVDQVQATQPDLVLMDIRLSGTIDGVTAATKIQTHTRVPTIIYLTAYADEETLQRAKVTEPFGYIIKPFEERQLYSTIEMALYKARMEHELEQWAAALTQTNSDLRTEIAERKRAEEALHDLSHRFLQAQETERSEIARELHDEIGQALTALKINLESVHAQAESHAAQNVAIDDRLTDSLHIVGRLLQQVRDLSLNLRPSLLDDLGLVAALRWYIDRQAQRIGFSAEFMADPIEPRPSPAIETVCFRVAQEAVTNMVRHAEAQRVYIELRQEAHELVLRICDDGVGFDVQAAQEKALHTGSTGLRGMYERVQLVGGHIETLSAPGQGTEIRVSFPL